MNEITQCANKVIRLEPNGHKKHVDPQLLHHGLRTELPGSAGLQKEVQQVGAAGWYARMNVEVLAHVI